MQQAVSQQEAELQGLKAKLEQDLASIGGADLADNWAALEQAQVRLLGKFGCLKGICWLSTSHTHTMA